MSLTKLTNMNAPNRPSVQEEAHYVRSKHFNNLIKELEGSGLEAESITATTVNATEVMLGTGTIAAAGSTQADATAVTNQLTFVTAANATKGIILPSISENKVVIIVNTANATLKIYPASGEKIQGGTANANIILAAYGVFIAGYKAAGDWYATEITATTAAA
jgi:hypothetical protein